MESEVTVHQEVVLDVLLEKVYRDPKKPQDSTIELYSPDMAHKKTIYLRPVWRNIFGIPDAPNIPQPFAALVSWNTSPEGKIVVGFSEEYKIEVFDAVEGLLFDFSHSYEPVKVTQEDKETFFGGLIYSIKTSAGTIRQKEPHPATKKYAKFPDNKPAFNSLVVDSEGNILVSVYREKMNENYKYFDAFDPKGQFISTVQIDSKPYFNALYLAPVSEGCFWVREFDKEGYVKLVKYRISE